MLFCEPLSRCVQDGEAVGARRTPTGLKAIAELLKTLSTDDKDLRPSYVYAIGAAYARADDRPNALRYLRLAREQAAERQQAKLLEDIDHDLAILAEGERPR